MMMTMTEEKDLEPRELILKVTLYVGHIFFLPKGSLCSQIMIFMLLFISHFWHLLSQWNALQRISNLKSTCSPHTSKHLNIRIGSFQKFQKWYTDHSPGRTFSTRGYPQIWNRKWHWQLFNVEQEINEWGDSNWYVSDYEEDNIK